MALSLIDLEPIEDASNARQALITQMLRHRVVTTSVPTRWQAFPVTSVFGTGVFSLTVWGVAQFGLKGLIVGVAGVLPLITAFLEGMDRESARRMTGTHAIAWNRLDAWSWTLISKMRLFNDAFLALEGMKDIAPNAHKRAIAALTRCHTELTAQHERMVCEFEETFGPCIADYERRGFKRSDAPYLLETSRFDALAKTLHDYDPNLIKLLPAPLPSDPSALPDPLDGETLEERIAKLESPSP